MKKTLILDWGRKQKATNEGGGNGHKKIKGWAGLSREEEEHGRQRKPRGLAGIRCARVTKLKGVGFGIYLMRFGFRIPCTYFMMDGFNFRYWVPGNRFR